MTYQPTKDALDKIAAMLAIPQPVEAIRFIATDGTMSLRDAREWMEGYVTCTNKNIYDDVFSAARAGEKHDLGAYQCNYCRKWHLTSKSSGFTR